MSRGFAWRLTVEGVVLAVALWEGLTYALGHTQ